MEHTGEGEGVPYLDTLVTLETTNNQTTLETELYIKPTNSGIILHAKSAHPSSTKHNMVRNMFRRAIRNSSSKGKEEKSVQKIWSLLLGNGYSTKLLTRLLREVRRPRRTRERGTKWEKEGCDGFLTLPYIDENLFWKIKHIVRKSSLNLRLAWKNEKKLKASLVRSSISKPRCPGGRRCHTCKSGFRGDCTQRNVVYRLTCKQCDRDGRDTSYVGETMRPVRLRFNEHVRDACNHTENTPFGDHFASQHSQEDEQSPTIPSPPLDVRILYKAKDHPDRKIAESVLIREKRPPLNTQGSSWPIMRV